MDRAAYVHVPPQFRAPGSKVQLASTVWDFGSRVSEEMTVERGHPTEWRKLHERPGAQLAGGYERSESARPATQGRPLLVRSCTAPRRQLT